MVGGVQGQTLCKNNRSRVLRSFGTISVRSTRRVKLRLFIVSAVLTLHYLARGLDINNR